MYIILSDLHLGDGGPLEDFLLWGEGLAGPPLAARPPAVAALDNAFGRFLQHATTYSRERGFVPTLVLAGDTFDFWQAQLRREQVHITLQRILAAHASWVSALRHWIAEGGEAVILAGNHDHALVDPRAWALLREVFPGLNGRVGGICVHSFCDSACGLYVEHGHRWDPVNRINSSAGPRANPAGRRIVRSFVNAHEPQFPWIDKGSGLGDFLRALSMRKESTSESLQSLHESIKPGAPMDQVKAMNRGIKRALSAKITGAGGPMPQTLRFFVSGHTHEPLRLETRHGVTQLNSGTWRPVLRFSESEALRIEQQLHYIVLRPEQTRWIATLDAWPLH